jgi:hypothetical protein
VKELIDSFPQWVSEGAQRGGFVLVLDALNQLGRYPPNLIQSKKFTTELYISILGFYGNFFRPSK